MLLICSVSAQSSMHYEPEFFVNDLWLLHAPPGLSACAVPKEIVQAR